MAINRSRIYKLEIVVQIVLTVTPYYCSIAFICMNVEGHYQAMIFTQKFERQPVILSLLLNWFRCTGETALFSDVTIVSLTSFGR